MKELECPECGALIDVSSMEKYDWIDCHDCGESLEYIGIELILPDIDD